MKKIRRIVSVLIVLTLTLSLCGCVDQHPEKTVAENSKVVATSPATMEICSRLGIDLVGIPTTDDIPEQYADVEQVGTAMSPDVEKIAMLEPTDVIGPASLEDDIKPKYEAAGLPYTFIDLKSVQGMYDGITQLGEKYYKQDAAAQLVADYENTINQFNESIAGYESPRVLILMGLPGSYIESTPNSYVGSLLELAGAENVIQTDDASDDYVSWTTEDLLNCDPDYILLTAHGLPDEAMEMFKEEFEDNDIWSHFRAVQEGHVYQLDYDYFGMSATFDWPLALNELKQILYDGTYQSFEY